jgi:hypothetical protein
MTWDLGYLVGTGIFLSALVVMVGIQIAAKKFHPFLYWSVPAWQPTRYLWPNNLALEGIGPQFSRSIKIAELLHQYTPRSTVTAVTVAVAGGKNGRLGVRNLDCAVSTMHISLLSSCLRIP